MEIGDTISSPAFRFVEVDSEGKTAVVVHEVETQWLAPNEERAKAHFVIECIDQRFTQTGHKHCAFFSGYKLYWARRLNSDGSYDEKGELLCFSVAPWLPGSVNLKDIQQLTGTERNLQ